MLPLAATSTGVAFLFMELGAAIFGLALLTRIAWKIGLSPIPLYLLAGLALGRGGLVPMRFSDQFVQIGAEVGVVLLLFMLGLEYTGSDLARSLRRGIRGGVKDLLLNFPPGFLLALALGWGPIAGFILGGVTYVSSSGIIAKLLSDLGSQQTRESKTVVTILVQEDLVMALYLPLASVLIAGLAIQAGLIAVAVALGTVLVILYIAVRLGRRLSGLISGVPDEILLLSTFGLLLLVAGGAQLLHVSAAVGAFLVGVAVSGPAAVKVHEVFSPLRDLFAATFFLFVGLDSDPGALVPVLPMALGLAVVTAGTKVLTGLWATARRDIEMAARWRAGVTLIARGEFSIVIASMGASLQPQLQPLATAYVLILAVAGPILARLVR